VCSSDLTITGYRGRKIGISANQSQADFG